MREMVNKCTVKLISDREPNVLKKTLDDVIRDCWGAGRVWEMVCWVP